MERSADSRGRRPDTPVAIVRRVTWPDQQTIRTTLVEVADLIEATESARRQ